METAVSELTAPRALRDSDAIARPHSLNRLQQANQDSKQLVSMIFFFPSLLSSGVSLLLG